MLCNLINHIILVGKSNIKEGEIIKTTPFDMVLIISDMMEYSDRLFEFDNMFQNGQMKIDVGELYQVSELSVIRGGEIALHTQRCDEITYAISGSADFISGDECIKIKAGQIHFIRKGLSHKIEVSCDRNFRYICIGFIPDLGNKAVKTFYDVCGNKEYFSATDNGTVKILSEFLIREFYNYDDYSPDMINQYISQILTTLARILSPRDNVYNINHSKTSGNYAMYKMLRFVDREYMQITNIGEVAKALSYSEYYLSHLFREKMGITLKEYITKKKIAYASELLRTSELTVEHIAETLNFSSPHTFRRVFKQHMSMTPMEYKTKTIANFVPLNDRY